MLLNSFQTLIILGGFMEQKVGKAPTCSERTRVRRKSRFYEIQMPGPKKIHENILHDMFTVIELFI